MEKCELESSPLGKASSYPSEYSSNLLVPIPRQGKRDEINVLMPLPFKGFDIWNAFELSWLNLKGKPVVAIAKFVFPCESMNIVESKSFKLYLNSFNNTRFESTVAVQRILENDLSLKVESKVVVEIYELTHFENMQLSTFDGECLDDLEIECDEFVLNPGFLQTSEDYVEEQLFSNLLKSNCLVTGQPDWGSVYIDYKGTKIDKEGLLRYIVSFRNHNEFHEQCVERIFMDISRNCKPERLTVEARYTRRGGLDINPVRSTEIIEPTKNIRMARQ